MRGFSKKFIVEERDLPSSTKRSLYVWAACLAVTGSVCFLLLLISVLQGQASAIDAPFVAWIGAARSPTLTSAMIWLAIIFGPIVLPIVVLIVIVAWGFFARHLWRPLLLAGGMLTGLITVQVVTRLVGRARPPVDQMLFGIDTTFSFPSGHVLGAADFLLLVTYLVFSRRGTPRTAAISYCVAVAMIAVASVSRIYLGYHWPTDALASLSISLVILGSVIAIDTGRTVRTPG
jgi:undecaprenyl-diphosphatase